MPIQETRPEKSIRAGFTLVELLVVIGVIALLMGILIPVVSGVKKRGYEVKTKALISKISNGCHAYYLDWRAYPGLVDEDNVAGGANANPNIGGLNVGNGANVVTSSENLVLSLLGGVAAPTTPGGQPQFVASLIGSGAQSLNPAEPKQYQAYIDVQKNEISEAGHPFDPDTTNFQGTQDSIIPEFVDAYFDPQPIIYMRARAGRKGIIDTSTMKSNGSDPMGTSTEAQYNAAQITPYFDPPKGPFDPNTIARLVEPDFSTRKSSPRSWGDYFRNSSLTSIDPNTGIINSTPEVPRGRDTFILFSAGTDRRWFTADDIIFGD